MALVQSSMARTSERISAAQPVLSQPNQSKSEARMSWRDRSEPIISKVLTETAGKSEKEIKKALFEAYPFGERRYHPYKIWLSEIKRQRGSKDKTPSKTALQKLQEWEYLYGK